MTLYRRVLVNSRWSQQWNRQPLLHLWGNQARTAESERRSSQFAALQAHFLLCRMFVSFYCIFIYQFFKCPSLGACLQPGTPTPKHTAETSKRIEKHDCPYGRLILRKHLYRSTPEGSAHSFTHHRLCSSTATCHLTDSHRKGNPHSPSSRLRWVLFKGGHLELTIRTEEACRTATQGCVSGTN